MIKKTNSQRRRIQKKPRKPRDSRSKKPKVALWDQAARWYDALVGDQGSDYHRSIVMPNAFKLMNLKKGSRVLDLACGQGVFSRFLYQRGLRVVGLDISEELIRFAEKRSDPGIKFCVGDAQKKSTLENEKFDGIVCLLAMQNIESLEGVLKNVKKWLKSAGMFVMVVTHPCFRIPRQTHWGWDEEKKIQYRRVDMYSQETAIPILTPPFATSSIYTLTYHRPLESYFSNLARAGFAVDSLEEWVSEKKSQPGKRAKAENRARNEIPLFLALRSIVK